MTRACLVTAALAGGIAFAYLTTGALGDPVVPGAPAVVTVRVPVTVRVQTRSHGHSAGYWHLRNVQARVRLNHASLSLRHANQTIRRETLEARRRWDPTLRSAVTLASSVTGVSASDMLRVAYCESTWNPFAVNGRYKGYWQLGWMPFGLSPFDPYAAALSTAMTVEHDGGWRQWECKP